MKFKPDVLLEDKKSQLLAQAKQGANYKDTSKGKNRYERRKKSKLASSVKNFNAIDMDKFFKSDILDVSIDVKGETSNYTVRISFLGTLNEIHNFQNKPSYNEDAISRKTIARSLSRAFMTSDVYFNCTCADFRFRHKFHATKKDNLIGDPETRPIRRDVYHAGGLESANYYDNQGPACKHVILALQDSSWLIKVTSVIYNYIQYMKDHREREYQKYIYPAIYQEPYPAETTQLDLTDIEPERTKTEDNIDISEYQEIVDDDLQNNNGKLSVTTRALIDDAGLSLMKNPDGSYTVRGNKMTTSPEELNKAIKLGRERGLFKPGNKYRFKKKTKDNQEKIDFDKLEKDLD